jgi:hypothetical protein
MGDRVKYRIMLVCATLQISGCSDSEIYTLYRNSTGTALGENARIHIATFDSSEKGDYNRGNCIIAEELFKGQPGVKVRYWCEKGRYRA